VVTLIWKYFKHVPSEPGKRKDEGLPELTGPLSKSVLVKAIELTNTQVEKLVQLDKTHDSEDANKGKCNWGGYLMLTPAQDMKLARGQQNTGQHVPCITLPKSIQC